MSLFARALPKIEQDDDNYGTDNHRAAIKRAEDAGFEVVRGSDRALLLDYDDMASGVERWNSLSSLIDDNFGIVSSEFTPSKTVGHGHGIVTLSTPLSSYAHIALQSALGSDPKREILGIVRLLEGVEGPSVLFRPKKELNNG